MPRKYLSLLIIIIIILLVYVYHSISLIGTSLLVNGSTNVIYQVILMDDRQPFYKLTTLDGHKPYADGDRAQATVVKHLDLVKKCRNDSSLIVVDVGAYLGDFGLYAAACGCQVYIFEVQPDMVDVIKLSIVANKFPSTRVRIINKAVSNKPSGSTLKFLIADGSTTAQNGSLTVETIRLDDVQWPIESKILLLKIDVEGFELDVLRSAENLFRQKRIEHLIFEYTAFWTDRAVQKDLLPYVEKTLHADKLYALHRTEYEVYGPLTQEMLNGFHENHVKSHLQTDIYATFIETNGQNSIGAKEYDPKNSFA